MTKSKNLKSIENFKLQALYKKFPTIAKLKNWKPIYCP